MESVRLKSGPYNALISSTRVIQISSQEKQILLHLMCNKFSSPKSLMRELWPNSNRTPDTWLNVIHVLIHNVKNKLKDINSFYTIKNSRSHGYSLKKYGDSYDRFD